MIKKLEMSEIDSIMKIWLQTNIKAHDFIPKSYWMENYDFVKKFYLKQMSLSIKIVEK
ncbi:hypothetical protein [Clostridiisalibacter paucivorans]|uniref:hypothetical protein n=1 Tax=Clostridiisalibacter paucivorans TaxID=408753 RepID=UPI002022DF98|nr:hypothetical protein [Clostridiisalibacter paucivorans]